MLPPQWVLVNSRRLDLDEFGACFDEAWSRLHSRFRKLECRQVYQERETNKSQEAYNMGRIEES